MPALSDGTPGKTSRSILLTFMVNSSKPQLLGFKTIQRCLKLQFCLRSVLPVNHGCGSNFDDCSNTIMFVCIFLAYLLFSL